MNQPQQPTAPGAVVIDDKFHVWPDGAIRNRVSGEAIPDEEPRFLLRARDINAVPALFAYREQCYAGRQADTIVNQEAHVANVDRIIGKFLQYAKEHPERMKQPGITGDIRESEASEL